jgi:hypothetical protein
MRTGPSYSDFRSEFRQTKSVPSGASTECHWWSARLAGSVGCKLLVVVLAIVLAIVPVIVLAKVPAKVLAKTSAWIGSTTSTSQAHFGQRRRVWPLPRIFRRRAVSMVICILLLAVCVLPKPLPALYLVLECDPSRVRLAARTGMTGDTLPQVGVGSLQDGPQDLSMFVKAWR